jgi:hypothetical protein
MTGIMGDTKKFRHFANSNNPTLTQSIPYITEPSTMFQDKMYYYA